MDCVFLLILSLLLDRVNRDAMLYNLFQKVVLSKGIQRMFYEKTMCAVFNWQRLSN